MKFKYVLVLCNYMYNKYCLICNDVSFGIFYIIFTVIISATCV